MCGQSPHSYDSYHHLFVHHTTIPPPHWVVGVPTTTPPTFPPHLQFSPRWCVCVLMCVWPPSPAIPHLPHHHHTHTTLTHSVHPDTCVWTLFPTYSHTLLFFHTHLGSHSFHSHCLLLTCTHFSHWVFCTPHTAHCLSCTAPALSHSFCLVSAPLFSAWVYHPTVCVVCDSPPTF